MFFSRSSNAFFASALARAHKRAGTWPSDAVEVSEEEWQEYGLGQPPEGKLLGSDENGRPTWVQIPPFTLDTLAARKRTEIDAERDRAFAEGLPYDVGGEPDVVQTRPQDQINLLGLSAKAQRLKAEGITEPVMPFRGFSNITRSLTPEQMDALALAALAHIESIYQRSWDLKDTINIALNDENLDDDAKRSVIEKVNW